MSLLDGYLDLANLAILLVLASALVSLSLSPLASLCSSAMAILAFNWAFVSPRGTLVVDLREQVLLLITMLAVSWIVALLMGRQRALAHEARRHAQQADQLRMLGEALRDARAPLEQVDLLGETLEQLTGGPVTLLIPGQDTPANGENRLLRGRASIDQYDGLRLILTTSQAMGPGTGRHEEQNAWFLPMRGRTASFGAALLPVTDEIARSLPLREHAQALCDQMGLALERAHTLYLARTAHAEAQLQGLRNTLLAAIAHDHRTPLATILGAASALLEQNERLSSDQRQRLAATIVDEAQALTRLTDNTLQLARLDSPDLELRMDWESLEEIVGSVLQRVRRRDPERRVQARLAPGLPLLRCNAVLLVQLLDNLLDNALKYSDAGTAVEVQARQENGRLLLAVLDRGPGIAPEWRERVFTAFERGGAPDTAMHRGVGVGLALCRAIARVNGGQLYYRPREGGGACFECSLPLTPLPPHRPHEAPHS